MKLLRWHTYHEVVTLTYLSWSCYVDILIMKLLRRHTYHEVCYANMLIMMLLRRHTYREVGTLTYTFHKVVN
jgi:hypothetical protein